MVKAKKRHPIPMTKKEPKTIIILVAVFHFSLISSAQLVTSSKMEKTEMPSQRPMELPKSFNKETGVSFSTLLVTRTFGLKLSLTYFLLLWLFSSECLLFVAMFKVVQESGQKENKLSTKGSGGNKDIETSLKKFKKTVNCLKMQQPLMFLQYK